MQHHISAQLTADELTKAPQSVNEYVVPSGIRTIGKEAFVIYEEGEEGYFVTDNPIRSIIVSEGVEYIDKRAFASCTELTHLSLPSTLQGIGEGAFVDCIALRREGIENLAENIHLSELGIISEGVLIHAFDTHSTLDFKEEAIRSIGVQAFWGCTNLEKVTLETNIKHIGEGAWGQCASLRRIHIPEGITALPPRTFAGCTELVEVILPTSLREIGDECFSDCSSLRELQLPEGLERIGEGAFSWCTALTHINLPKNLKYIGKEAFYDCLSLPQSIKPKSI